MNRNGKVMPDSNFCGYFTHAIAFVKDCRVSFFVVLGISLLGLLVLSGCERPVRISIDGKNPPTFTLEGSGEIQMVSIWEITPEGKVPGRGSGFWVLYPTQATKAWKSPPITYGVVPESYQQAVPSSGTASPLKEGRVYGFGVQTRNAPGGSVWFTIRDGKSMRVPKTDPADPDMR
jgi:hypothetical protein